MHHTYQNTKGTWSQRMSDLYSSVLNYVDTIYGTGDPREAFRIIWELDKRFYSKLEKTLKLVKKS